VVQKIKFNCFFILILILNINNLLSQVGIVSDNIFTTYQNNETIRLPLFSNVDTGFTNSETQRAIIVVPSQNRDTNDYFNSINSITTYSGFQGQTLVVAPQFLRIEDVEF